jgi:lysophospholipase L1-like esterase
MGMMRSAALVCMLALAACAPAGAQTETADASYRVIGRHIANDDGSVQVAWPASGIEGGFRGSELSVTIEDAGETLMDVTIDGVTETLALEPGVHRYELRDWRNVADHRFRITRKSEIFSGGVSIIRGVDIGAGDWIAPPAYDHRMLVLGDSISAGYGVLGADQTCSYSAETGAPLQTYAALTAAAFNAELNLIAISGRGVTRNYAGGEGLVMGWQLDKALPDHEPLWDPSAFRPELVVVNLGANDFSPGYPDAEIESRPGEKFETEYAALLGALRAAYPEARIIAAIGPLGESGVADAVARAVAAHNASANDAVGHIVLERAQSGHVWGCDWHPGVDSQRVMAAQLIGMIENELGWTRAR